MSLLWIALFIMLAGLYAGMETGGYLLNRIRLRTRVRVGNRSAQHLQKVLASSHLFIFTVLIGHNIAVYLVSRNVTQLYLNSGHFGEDAPEIFGFLPWNAEIAATLTLMLPLFLLAEIIPKNLFHRHADTLMYRFSGLLRLSWGLFWPVTALLQKVFTRLAGGKGAEEALGGFTLSLQGLRDYFSGESFADRLSEHQHGMINNLVSMRRIPVRELMRPVSAVVSMPDRATAGQVLEVMRQRDCEQVALYHGGVRHLAGYVTLFDLMNPDLNPQDPVLPHLRKMIHLSAGLSATRAFRRLRREPGAPAVIVDRTSQALGVVHLRDIAGYIVSGH
jgi:CBS domain containing-hemolysin-like protein